MSGAPPQPSKLRARGLLLLDFLLPVALGVGMVIAAWVIHISRCRGDFTGDEENHFFSSLAIYRDLGFRQTLVQVYPPIVYLWSCLHYVVWGISKQVAELSVALLYIPLALAIYHAAKEFGGRAAGVLGLFLLCFHKTVFTMSHAYMLDLPMLLLVTLSLWALIRSRLCEDRFYSVLLGVFTALGFLVRYNFFYACFPLLLLGLYLLYRSTRSVLVFLVLLGLGAVLFYLSGSEVAIRLFSDGQQMLWLYALAPLLPVALYLGLINLPKWRLGARLIRDRRSFVQFCNLALAGTIALAVSLPWYLNQFRRLWEYWDDMNMKATRHTGGKAVFFQQLSEAWTGVLVMTILGLVLIPFFRKRADQRLIVAGGGLLSLLLIMASMEPQYRFLLPVFPFVILTATWWLGKLGRAGWLVTAGVVALNLALALQVLLHNPIRHGTLLANDIRLPHLNSNDARYGRERCESSKQVERLVRTIRELGAAEVTLVFRDEAQWEKYKMMNYIQGLNTRMLMYKLQQPHITVRDFLLEDGDEMRVELWNPVTLSHQTKRAADVALLPGGLVLVLGEIPEQRRDLTSSFAHHTGYNLKPLSTFMLWKKRGFSLHRLQGIRRMR